MRHDDRFDFMRSLALLRGWHGLGRNYPELFRQAAAKHAVVLLEQGWTLTECAEALGCSPSSLSNWISKLMGWK